MPRRPPGTERVVQQELHHIMLGEELRHGTDCGGIYLLATSIDLLFSPRLPELVHPAQTIVGGKDRLWQCVQELLQLLQILRRKRNLKQWIVGAEDLRQHAS